MKLVNIKFLIIFLMVWKANMLNAQLVKENLFALPTYTYTNFSGVSSPNTGSLVYNLTDNKLYFYNGSNWITMELDTTFLNNRINLRLKLSDTAAMLSKYLRKVDTTAMLSKYIYAANNGFTKTGKLVQLGGTLIQPTTITTTSSNTLTLAGLGSGLSTDSILTVTSAGLIKKKSNFPLILNKTASYTLTASDHGAVITVNSSSATTITVPASLPIGFNISIYQIGTGKITIAGASGVTLKNRLLRFRTAGKDAGVGVVITASNVAHLTGDLAK